MTSALSQASLKELQAKLKGRKLPTLTEVRAEQSRRSLVHFVKAAWPIVEPNTPLVWGWHVDAICLHLEALSRGELPDNQLIISLPPGHLKSLLVAVLWPAWMWTRNPSWRILSASYSDDLAVRDAYRARNVIESEWYRNHFSKNWKLSTSQNVKHFYENTLRGFRIATTVAGQGTGHRADAILVDDPMKVQDSFSRAARENTIRWWDQTMSNRGSDPRKVQKVIIHQRLHTRDLAGHLLEQGGWTHLNLATEFRVSKKCVTPIWKDPRQNELDLLFPQMYGRKEIEKEKRTLGLAGFSAQHQQDPVPPGGAMFKRHWFNRRWRRPSEPELEGMEMRLLPPNFVKTIIVVDCSFKGESSEHERDYVCAGVWGYAPPDRYLLDVSWDIMDFPTTLAAIVDLMQKHPAAREVCIEDKANGSAIIDVLRKRFPRIIALEPMGGKEARASATTPDCEAGNVWLPAYAPWVKRYLEEVCSFPNGDHDDAIDQQSYALLRLDSSIPAHRMQQLVAW